MCAACQHRLGAPKHRPLRLLLLRLLRQRRLLRRLLLRLIPILSHLHHNCLRRLHNREEAHRAAAVARQQPQLVGRSIVLANNEIVDARCQRLALRAICCCSGELLPGVGRRP